MKITRSQLKNLIKEEMNRINEAVPTTSGEDVNQYALEGMTVYEIANAFEALVNNRGSTLSGLNIEGMKGLRIVYRRSKQARREKGNRPVQVAIRIGHHNPVYNSRGGEGGTYAENTDRTAWATASIYNEIPETEAESLREVIQNFNSQNDGKGGKVTLGSQDKFHFTASDNKSDHPSGGPLVFLS